MKRIDLLDYGRFAAALAVMATHYFSSGFINHKITSIGRIDSLAEIAKYGYPGVEFFFIISGYVIFYSAQNKNASEFIVSRCVRLFPAFWCAVAITTVTAQFWGHGSLLVSFRQFFSNLTMFPWYFGEPYVDGVYWTLQYEWKFYISVYVVMLFVGSEWLKRLLCIWPLYIAVNQFMSNDWILSNGYYSYFSAGALFGIIKEKRSLIPIAMLLLVFVICQKFSLHNAAKMTLKNGTYYSPIVVFGFISGMFVFFVSLYSRGIQTQSLPWAGLLGAMSYPIYLTHAHFGFMAISKFADESNKGWIYLATASFVLLMAYLIHIVLERRGVSLWRRVFANLVGRPMVCLEGMLFRLRGLQMRNE